MAETPIQGSMWAWMMASARGTGSKIPMSAPGTMKSLWRVWKCMPARQYLLLEEKAAFMELKIFAWLMWSDGLHNSAPKIDYWARITQLFSQSREVDCAIFESQLCTSLPDSEFISTRLIPWNQPWWGYLHKGNRKMLSLGLSRLYQDWLLSINLHTMNNTPY